jgi:hypothetical protein
VLAPAATAFRREPFRRNRIGADSVRPIDMPVHYEQIVLLAFIAMVVVLLATACGGDGY